MNMYQKLKEQFRKENSIIRTVKNKDNPYVMINKQGVQDPNLSWAAKGLLAYLLSLPDNWTIYAKELLKHTSSGETNTYTVIRELLRHGYMEKIEYRYKGKTVVCYNSYPDGIGQGGVYLLGECKEKFIRYRRAFFSAAK